MTVEPLASTASTAAAAGRDAFALHIATTAQLACLLEVMAPKPGNVSPGRHFGDTRYEDFLASAAAIGPAMAAASPLGATIRVAVQATARWTRANTNLGIILLLAPLAAAARRSAFAEATARQGVQAAGVVDPAELRAALRRVLAETTVDDAREVYAAIRLASPGGLGRAEAQDVAGEPDATLTEVMRLAADRDGIAREYHTAFDTTFARSAPALVRARADGLDWDAAIVETYLDLLAASPDTHIARRAGHDAAADVSRLAKAVVRRGGVRTANGREAIAGLDAELRGAGNARNPGTTADLTAAAIFVALLGGEWERMQGGRDAATR